MFDGEPPSVIWESYPRARKSHKCCECYDEIPPGGRYQKVSGVWSHEFSCYKSCTACARLRDYMRDHGFNICYSELKESYEESELKIPGMVVLGMQAR